MWVAKDGTVRHAAVIARLRRDVIAKQPVDDRERQSLRAFVEAFDQLDEPFAQESNSIHVTGSALVVGPRGVVLLKHKRLGFWLQPGGHIDPGESPWAAALREAREETGLEVHFVGPLDDEGVPELLHVDVHPGGRGHTHLDVRYLLDGGDADPDPPEGESQEIGWYDWEAAVEQADPGLEGILRFLQRRGLDLHE
ncbi:MAG: NUDIX domain-containing protein [Ilumatobacter sp.]|jgi:8-oxo-dGTP pyrophosphatase MutT (NUDIX family)|nr:NUDIX domain-containing protein [Ilumatobacter sp.]MBT5276982.1 NUDIX domain-containing protein [Ilumatobacter sp.]MBT5552987.1 NUDIX domain-containing protein [Ilumatobacter sp.]MBT5867189.1 NUDIX domain-containing protein [Ilumatobacter sp.]